MRKQHLLRFGLAAVALGAIAFGAWLLTLPAPVPAGAPPAIARAEAEATLAALNPLKRAPSRQRPLIAIVGINEGTETTDYLMPYGILRRADIADVTALATRPGPVTLYPALTVEPQATLADFDARHPAGADYVIVPAMRRDDDPAVLAWLKRQSAKGATIIGVCAGAKIVAEAGLLDGRRATTHWYYLDALLGRHPTIRYVADRRFVVDAAPAPGSAAVATTTGITASLTMSLTLIEAIAGREKAEAVARDLGVAAWDARHRSDTFRFTRPFALTALGNALAFWGHEDLGLALAPGMDEVALALVADAWSRTYRSRAVTYAAGAVETRHGLNILADKVTKSWPPEQRLPSITGRAQEELDRALSGIAERYGARTRDFVAMQMEYPRPEKER